MTSSRKALALLLMTVVRLAQAEETNKDSPAQDDSELETMFESPYNKFVLTKLFVGQYYENTYKKINDYLVDNLETPDPEANLKFALEWLNKEKAKSSSSSNLIEALTQFTALLKTNHRCDRVSNAILLKNDRATNKEHIYARPLGQRRIDRIVHYYWSKVSTECISTLPERYQKKLATMDQDVVKKVENVFGDDLIRDDNRILIWNILSHLLGSNADRRYLSLVHNEKTGRLEIDATKLKQLLERELTDIRAPCQYYVNELGPDVFTPAFYFFQMYSTEYREAPWLVTQSMRRFGLCKIILGKQDDLLSELIGTISSRSRLI